MAREMTPELLEARRKRIERRANRPPTRVKLAEEVYIKQPSRIEEKRISRLLRKSGFIPMLDDLPPA
jgi:hypothetical protein